MFATHSPRQKGGRGDADSRLPETFSMLVDNASVSMIPRVEGAPKRNPMRDDKH